MIGIYATREQRKSMYCHWQGFEAHKKQDSFPAVPYCHDDNDSDGNCDEVAYLILLSLHWHDLCLMSSTSSKRRPNTKQKSLWMRTEILHHSRPKQGRKTKKNKMLSTRLTGSVGRPRALATSWRHIQTPKSSDGQTIRKRHLIFPTSRIWIWIISASLAPH